MYNCSFDVGEPSILEKQDLPLRRQVTPYLPTVTILGMMEAEAGDRAQSVVKQAGNNTGANGEMERVNKSWKSVLGIKLQPEQPM